MNHSTETYLLHVTNSWLANMDADLNNGVLFLDLKKNFDTLNHKRVLKGGGGVQSHFPPEILAKSQSPVRFIEIPVNKKLIYR
jgi:hypothetical protein